MDDSRETCMAGRVDCGSYEGMCADTPGWVLVPTTIREGVCGLHFSATGGNFILKKFQSVFTDGPFTVKPWILHGCYVGTRATPTNVWW